ncbi:MAG: c-type cytochrome [Shimia sp.]
MDTMTATKVTAALCGSLLIFLLGSWLAEELYHVGGDHYGDHAQAYTIPVESDEPAEDVVEVPFAERYAAADASRGERVWGKCRSCHVYDAEQNGTGPHLVGLVGRDIAAADGYGYSNALLEIDGAWTPEELYLWLENPSDYAPGTSMGYRLQNPEERLNLIAWLETLGS